MSPISSVKIDVSIPGNKNKGKDKADKGYKRSRLVSIKRNRLMRELRDKLGDKSWRIVASQAMSRCKSEELVGETCEN